MRRADADAGGSEDAAAVVGEGMLRRRFFNTDFFPLANGAIHPTDSVNNASTPWTP